MHYINKIFTATYGEGGPHTPLNNKQHTCWRNLVREFWVVQLSVDLLGLEFHRHFLLKDSHIMLLHTWPLTSLMHTVTVFILHVSVSSLWTAKCNKSCNCHLHYNYYYYLIYVLLSSVWTISLNQELETRQKWKLGSLIFFSDIHKLSVFIWKCNDKLWFYIQSNVSFNSESSPLFICEILRLSNYQKHTY